MKSQREQLYCIIRQIPVGKVSTYGDLATFSGRPRAAREVGWALAALSADSDVPWWRVVNAQGQIPFRPQCADLQADLLRAEGVPVSAAGRLPLSRHRWEGPSEPP